MAVPYNLYSENVKIVRQGGTDNFWASWSLSSGQKKKKITKKVYKKKKKKKQTNTYPSVIDGYTIKWYYKVNRNSNEWYISKTIDVTSDYSTTKHDLWTPPENAVAIKLSIKPKSKSYKSSKSNTSKWFTADYTSVTDSDYDETPSAPSINTFSIIDKTLKASVLCSLTEFDRLETAAVRLQVLKDSKKLLKFKRDSFEIVDSDADGEYFVINKYTKTDPLPSSGIVHFEIDLESVGAYQVRGALASYDKDYKWSEYSSWSSSVDTRPEAPKITELKAIGADKIKIAWTAVKNISQYKIEYVNDSTDYFDSDMIKSTTVTDTTSYIMSGLEVGHTIYFRIRSVNGSDESSPSDVKSVVLATKPSPPTTWSSLTKASITSELSTTDPVYLYWIHNTSDGSVQERANLEFDILGTKYYLNKENTEVDESGEAIDKTTTLSLWDLEVCSDKECTRSAGTIYSIFKGAGAKEIKWKVATKGVHDDYSDWSVERVIEAYEKPNIELTVTDGEGLTLTGDVLYNFPLCVSAKVTPVTQTPISFHIGIVSGEAYETTDAYGEEKIVSEGDEIFTRYLDKKILGSTTLTDYALTPSDVDFESGITYTLTVVVYTDAGLNASAEYTFSVDWDEIGEEPDAVIDFNETYRYATITPFSSYFIGYESENDEAVPEGYEPVAYIGTAISGEAIDKVFASSGVLLAVAGDIYLNESTYEAYVCTSGGDPSTSKWTYRTTFDYSDAATWYSGTAIDGEQEDDIYPNSGIASAVFNDFYLNTTSGDIFKCVKAGTPGVAIWQYVWNCFWQITPDITLSVYRKEQNGNYVTIAEGIDNTLQSTDSAIMVRDPHPSFNNCTYRIVSTNTKTGAIGYVDILENFYETSVVIQWAEVWKDIVYDIDEYSEEIFEGSILELPANIKISDQNSNDVNLVSYIGRDRQVAYYGTQRGESLTINCSFPKEDADRLTILRRLMAYRGDVYIREPSGLGYWANVKVSYNRDYSDLTIPVTINVTPVEGGK